MVERTQSKGCRSWTIFSTPKVSGVRRQHLPAPFGTPRPGCSQTGLPSMDFDGIDWPAHHQFVGPLLPPRTGGPAELPFADRLAGAPSVVVVSQGTVDNRDPEKLFVPTSRHSRTPGILWSPPPAAGTPRPLRQRFPHDNVIVEDWVDYAALLPHADVFVSNGGYGSIMQAIMAGVLIVSAGWFGGQNDINARLAYRKLAVDLRTERPTPAQITKAIGTVTGDPTYRTNIAKVAAELRAATPVDTVVDAILADRL